MRSHAKVLLNVVAIAGVLIATSDSADAGLLQSWPVQIDTANRTAQGSLGSARNVTSDSVQYIGCWDTISGYNTAGKELARSGGCKAVDSTGKTVSCAFPAIPPPPPGSDAPLAGQYFMSSDALIVFTWNSNNVCTGIQVWQYASLSPKQP